MTPSTKPKAASGLLAAMLSIAAALAVGVIGALATASSVTT